MMKNHVKIIRVTKGIQQKELAKQVGITRQTMGLIEREEYNPSLRLCVAIAKALNTTLDALFWEESWHEQ